MWDIQPDGDKFLMIKSPVAVVDEGKSEESATGELRKIIVVTH
jgi:hypothetical protein